MTGNLSRQAVSCRLFTLILLSCCIVLLSRNRALAAEDTKVAAVNGQPITRQMLMDRLLSEFGKGLIEDMINEMIVRQEAERLKVEVSDKEVDARVDTQKAGLPFGQSFEEWLADRRLTLPAYRERIGIIVMLEKMVAPQVKVTEEAAASLYLRSPELFGEPEQVRVRGILRKERDDAEKILKFVRNSPQTFDALARKNSQDPSSAVKGGDLGWKPMVEMKQYGLTSEAGKTTDIVVRVEGYWIYQVVDYKPAVKKPWKEVEPLVHKFVFEQQVASAAVRRFSDLKSTAQIERILYPDVDKKKP
jgi:foldase protein PrsA